MPPPPAPEDGILGSPLTKFQPSPETQSDNPVRNRAGQPRGVLRRGQGWLLGGRPGSKALTRPARCRATPICTATVSAPSGPAPTAACTCPSRPWSASPTRTAAPRPRGTAPPVRTGLWVRLSAPCCFLRIPAFAGRSGGGQRLPSGPGRGPGARAGEGLEDHRILISVCPSLWSLCDPPLCLFVPLWPCPLFFYVPQLSPPRSQPLRC